jgi:hypothetical protein
VADRRLPDHPRIAGAWLATWSALFGVIGVAIATLMLVSALPEFVENENLLLFPPLDLLLLAPAAQWLRGRPATGWVLLGYPLARLVLSAAVLVLHAAGVLIQTPLAFVALSAVLSLLLYRVARSARA